MSTYACVFCGAPLPNERSAHCGEAMAAEEVKATEPKHSPGPWIQWADTNIIIRKHSGAPRAEDLRICEVSTNTWHDEGRYNARLIAAAPELLALLKRAHPYLDDGDDLSSLLLANEISAVIAKAEAK